MKSKSFYQEEGVMRKCVQDKDVKKDIHNHNSLSCFCNLECKTYFMCLKHLNLLMHHA